jgi:hypothetical protein
MGSPRELGGVRLCFNLVSNSQPVLRTRFEILNQNIVLRDW